MHVVTIYSDWSGQSLIGAGLTGLGDCQGSQSGEPLAHAHTRAA